MGINVNALSPTEAKSYWYDYNNGNKNGLSEAEYQSICTKFRSYIDNWENDVDDNGYTAYDSPQDRLEYNADDAGFLNSDGKPIQAAANVGTAAAGGLVNAGVIPELEVTIGKASAATSAKSNSVSISLIATAALQFAMAMVTKANSPNKDAVEACLTAQDELYTEQANLADQVLTMEEMQEEMELLQEQAIATNEQGQGEIADLEGLYNYYYTKYQNGTATEREIAIMKALGAQMSSTQTKTNDETEGLNEEILGIGDGYEEITTNIERSDEFTNYVSEIDESTKTSAIVQGSIMILSAASAAVTATKCALRATALGSSIFGSIAAIAYIAAAALAAVATGIYGAEAAKQLGEYRSTAEDTIDLRKGTQDLSAETTEFQNISTEYWEETVDNTSEENLFTLTPSYANGPTPPQTGESEESPLSGEAQKSSPTLESSPNANDDKNKDDK